MYLCSIIYLSINISVYQCVSHSIYLILILSLCVCVRVCRDLSDNRLVVAREGTFRGLGHLTELTLAHNHLAHIEHLAFKATPSLLQL